MSSYALWIFLDIQHVVGRILSPGQERSQWGGTQAAPAKLGESIRMDRVESKKMDSCPQEVDPGYGVG